MTDFAWLIEAPGQNYLAVRVIAKVSEFHWSKDHNKALRFYNHDQADAVMMAVRNLEKELFGFALTLGEARPIEHGWTEPGRQGPP